VQDEVGFDWWWRRDVGFDEFKAFLTFQAGDIFGMAGDEIVQADDGVILAQKGAANMAANEAGASRD
jgi:hypothetical protein